MPERGRRPTLFLDAAHASLARWDDVAVVLSVLAAGFDLDLGDPTTLDGATSNGSIVRARVALSGGPEAADGADIDTVELPGCRGELEGPFPVGPFEASSPPDPEVGVSMPALVPAAGEGERLDPSRIHSFFRNLDSQLPERIGVGKGRPVLCASPNLGPARFAAVLEWTLRRDSAWVLEHRSEIFVPTVLWIRPSVLLARAEELRALALAFDETARKRSRLRAIVVVDSVEERLSDEERRRFGALFGTGKSELSIGTW